MKSITFPINILLQTLENNGKLAHGLLFPEILHFGNKIDDLHNLVANHAQKILEALPLSGLHQRQIGCEPTLDTMQFDLPPAERAIFWRTPLQLKFDLVRWKHNDDIEIIYIPTLDIEIISPTKDSESLPKRIEDNVRNELMRRKATVSLSQLIWLQRSQDIKLEQLTIYPVILTPKQLALNIKNEEEKSILKEVGTNLILERNLQLPTFENEATVLKLVDAISARNAKSVLLIGPSGVGKTAAVYEMVRRRADFNLNGIPFWSTNGSQLVAGMSGFGMWQQRCQELWREASKKKVVLYLGNLIELMEVGKSAHQTQGIASFLRPYILRGDLLVITECLPEQLSMIERDDPHLLESFYHINVVEPTVEQGRNIITGYALQHSKDDKLTIDEHGIEMLDRLHRRYATYSVYPGRPLRFLKNLFQNREADETLSKDKVIDAFSRETGLPKLLLDEHIKLDLTKTKEWFNKQVIGQPQAVNLITDLLAMVKTTLTRPQRPIASLLFIGPTGVGKTEMAKSLAEYLFQDRNRLVRFDMSEYADPIAVKRLIGGVTTSQGILTAKVREQPFLVLLLDEFEKADTSFFDLLLQMLGDGRLTDAGGRVADFRNAVVIMTSNLGAETFQRGTLGFTQDILTEGYADKHFTSEVRAFLRPELFNRIDRIVPFAPLPHNIIREIAKRELEKISLRDGIKYRKIKLTFGDGLADHLAQKGYDARYGARPLKRAMERELLVPLSEALNLYGTDVSLVAEATFDKTLNVSVTEEFENNKKKKEREQAINKMVEQSSQLRRSAVKLEISPAFLEVTNEIYRLERLARILAEKSYKKPDDLLRLTRLPILKSAEGKVKRLVHNVIALEDSALLAYYGKSGIDDKEYLNNYQDTYQLWRDTLITIYGLRFKQANEILLAVYGEAAKYLYELAHTYFRMFNDANETVELYKVIIKKEDKESKEEKDNKNNKWSKENKEREDEKEAGESEEDAEGKADKDQKKKPAQDNFVLEEVKEPAKYFDKPEKAVGLLFRVTGTNVYPKYASEADQHIFTENGNAHKCLVHISESSVKKYRPPENIHRRGSIGNQDKRRLYNHDENYAEDLYLKRRFVMGRMFKDVLIDAIDETLLAKALKII